MKNLSRKIRYKLCEMSHKGEAAHLGSSLSCVDLVLAAYSVLSIHLNDPSRDRFILSKGHAVSTLYAVLAHHRFFPIEWLDAFNADGGNLPEHPTPHCVPGVEMATGSLGHGLPVGLGIALAAKILGQNYRVMVLMSDGECNEGSVWEAALFAPAKKLDNVTVVIDFNKWQATGRSEEIMQLSPLKKKWEAFGWDTIEIDGHDHEQIISAYKKPSSKPKAIIAHTVKGKGISFMEDDNNWHYRIPTLEDLKKAKEELFS